MSLLNISFLFDSMLSIINLPSLTTSCKDVDNDDDTDVETSDIVEIDDDEIS